MFLHTSAAVNLVFYADWCRMGKKHKVLRFLNVLRCKRVHNIFLVYYYLKKTMGKQCSGMKNTFRVNGFLGPVYSEGIFRET